MQKIKTFLWFDTQAEEAANFYVSLFPDSKVDFVHRQGENLFMVGFTLAGTEYLALNAGPQFKFTEAISLYVDCADQAEVDKLWNAFLADGGEESECGWLKDKFGLSWQIIPKQLGELMGKDESGRVMQAMLSMKKIIVADLEKAYKGE